MKRMVRRRLRGVSRVNRRRTPRRRLRSQLVVGVASPRRRVKRSLVVVRQGIRMSLLRSARAAVAVVTMTRFHSDGILLR
jgi:hypothetical protein